MDRWLDRWMDREMRPKTIVAIQPLWAEATNNDFTWATSTPTNTSNVQVSAKAHRSSNLRSHHKMSYRFDPSRLNS